MEALAQPHWEALPLQVASVLKQLARATSLEPFYLAGGTALALRLGHRVSEDLDFFGVVETFDDAWRHRMIRDFNAKFAIQVPQDSPLGLVVEIEGVSEGRAQKTHRIAVGLYFTSTTNNVISSNASALP